MTRPRGLVPGPPACLRSGLDGHSFAPWSEGLADIFGFLRGWLLEHQRFPRTVRRYLGGPGPPFLAEGISTPRGPIRGKPGVRGQNLPKPAQNCRPLPRRVWAAPRGGYTPGFLIHEFWTGRKSSISGVWGGPGAPKTIQKYAGRSPAYV